MLLCVSVNWLTVSDAKRKKWDLKQPPPPFPTYFATPGYVDRMSLPLPLLLPIASCFTDCCLGWCIVLVQCGGTGRAGYGNRRTRSKRRSSGSVIDGTAASICVSVSISLCIAFLHFVACDKQSFNARVCFLSLFVVLFVLQTIISRHFLFCFCAAEPQQPRPVQTISSQRYRPRGASDSDKSLEFCAKLRRLTQI